MVGVIQPQWIARVYAGKSGRDHLGLGSVSSDQILPSLSPSINVLTFHPRYHSFYVFLLDEFWRRDLPRSWSSFREFFRPREFIFSLGANQCQMPEHGDLGKIVGAQKTEGWARQRQERYSYEPGYIKSELGGYGLYYRTVMAEVGIIYPAGQGLSIPFDVPSEFGKDVAQAFRQAIQETRYYREYFDGPHTDIPLDVIQEYIHCACLCQLKTRQAPDRPLLLDTFLHRGAPEQARARRETFRMFLDLAHQTQVQGLNEGIFRILVYFGETETGLRFVPGKSVQATYVRWRLYQAREYYAFALNMLWQALADWGVEQGGIYRPIPLQSFWDYVETHGLDFDSLTNLLELPGSGLHAGSRFMELLEWLKSVVRADGDGFDQGCGIHAPINEHRLYLLATQGQGSHPAATLAGMLVMLGLVFLRFGLQKWRERPEWEIARMGADRRLSMDLFLQKLAQKLDGTHATIAEVARWLYENDVILQHELVATSKLPENTFRFQRDGDDLHFQNLNTEVVFNNSRFDAISTTVYELGFCGDLSLPGHALTADGQKLLETGDM